MKNTEVTTKSFFLSHFVAVVELYASSVTVSSITPSNCPGPVCPLLCSTPLVMNHSFARIPAVSTHTCTYKLSYSVSQSKSLQPIKDC